MKLPGSLSIAFTMAMAAGSLAPVPAAAQQQPTASSAFSTGFAVPRGLRFDPDGCLSMAESGTGGTHGPANAD